MTLTVHALASGSSGNAILLRTGASALLIDCGLPLRTLTTFLGYQGLEPQQLTAVLLTHEHGDHALSAAALARRHAVPIVCNAATRAALGSDLDGLPVECLPVGELADLAAFEVQSFAVAHDAADPVGYRVNAGGATCAVAVDLGSWDEMTVASMRGANLLIVEANHDRELLRAAPYPVPIRQRICGQRGHLDNIQAGELIARAWTGPCDIWLAHLSIQSNRPRVALDGVGRVLTLADCRGARLQTLPSRAAKGPAGAPTWCAEERLVVQHQLF